MKQYEAPELYVDEYVPDTMIASFSPKTGNAGFNQNCWGCDAVFAQPNDQGDACLGPGLSVFGCS